MQTCGWGLDGIREVSCETWRSFKEGVVFISRSTESHSVKDVLSWLAQRGRCQLSAMFTRS